MPIETPVPLHSAGVPLAGLWMRPDGASLDDPLPTVVVTGSWLTVKEQMPLLYARRLASLGYNAFVFDFAGFGQSGGEPRQAELPTRKISDIRAAHAFARSHSFVDVERVGHLAICASAQYVLRAAAEGLDLAALPCVAGWFHDAGSVKAFYGGDEGVALRMERGAEAARAYAETGELRLVPAAEDGNDRAGMAVPVPYYMEADRGVVPEWRNEMAEMSWLAWLTFDGLRPAAKVSVPTLLVHSDGAVLPDNARTVHERLGGAKHLAWHPDGDQVDWYDQAHLVDRAVADMEDWFGAHLSSPTPALASAAAKG
jgi:fermentation-respiration switch protein FrsA (DUF1100 family)